MSAEIDHPQLATKVAISATRATALISPSPLWLRAVRVFIGFVSDSVTAVIGRRLITFINLKRTAVSYGTILAPRNAAAKREGTT
jgi:hypothetical protein